MRIWHKILIVILVVFTSCKSKKTISDVNTIHSISTKKIINSHYNNKFNQETVYARLNAKYKGKKSSASISVKLRLDKDKTIWMSATKLGIPIAKVIITPTKVSYYEKITKTFFEGDFSLISSWLGTDLDYNQLQNILLGQAVLNLKKGKYTSTIDNNLYEVKPKKNNELFDILFLLNPLNFKVNKQEIKQAEKNQLLSVSYPTYKKIEGELFPKKINIRAIENRNLTSINIEYRTVEFNKKLTFPFAIPNGYKEISLK